MMTVWLGGQAEVGGRNWRQSQNLKEAGIVLNEAWDIQDILQLKPSDQGKGGRERMS